MVYCASERAETVPVPDDGGNDLQLKFMSKRRAITDTELTLVRVMEMDPEGEYNAAVTVSLLVQFGSFGD
jgi:hypothetical protein